MTQTHSQGHPGRYASEPTAGSRPGATFFDRRLQETAKRIKALIPGYMTMGKIGMAGMADMHMPIPSNSIPMLGLTGQYGRTVFGGMATVVKVREKVSTYEDPGWYTHPPETQARPATPDELRALYSKA